MEAPKLSLSKKYYHNRSMRFCVICCKDLQDNCFPAKAIVESCYECRAISKRVVYYTKAGRIPPERISIPFHKNRRKYHKLKEEQPPPVVIPDIQTEQFHQTFY